MHFYRLGTGATYIDETKQFRPKVSKYYYDRITNNDDNGPTIIIYTAVRRLPDENYE